MRAACWEGPRRTWRRWTGSTPRSTRSPSESARPPIELDDAASALRSYLEGIEAEPGRLELVEERLHAVDRLKRKHGGSIEAVLSHGERCRAEIDRLENAEQLTGELERRLDQASRRRAGLAGELGEARAAGRPQAVRAGRG